MSWGTMTTAERVALLSPLLGAMATNGGHVSVQFRPREWAAVANALTVLDALAPAFSDAYREGYPHERACPHAKCDNPCCEGDVEGCHAFPAACECSSWPVARLLAALRPLMPGPVTP